MATKKMTDKKRTALYKELGMKPPKTLEERRREINQKAKALPTQVKRTFWQAMLDGKNVGEARSLAGIDDIEVAAVLVIQCYEKSTYTRLKTIDEIV